ncbi:MAG TPA: hypothetical protein VFS08_17060 [Gemmatimonadaceae bacterium]|nr:hypothetical protein [Gemmatimonadaceae bacterium]
MRDPHLPPDDADEPDFDGRRDPDARGDGAADGMGDADDADDEDDALALPEGHKVVFVSTAVPVQISVVPLDDERAPEGSALGSYIGERLVARCAMPREAIDHLLELDLFSEPVPLALLAVEEDPGLQCRLFALVPAERITDAEHDAEPWRASVPSFEDTLADDEDEDDDDVALAAGGAPGEEGDEDEDDEEDDDESTVASILLGHIVRFDRDRKFAGDLTAEAVDVLQKIVLGGTLQDANARAVDDLLDSL